MHKNIGLLVNKSIVLLANENFTFEYSRSCPSLVCFFFVQ